MMDQLNRNRIISETRTILFFIFFILLLSFCSITILSSTVFGDNRSHCSSTKSVHTNLQPIANHATSTTPPDAANVVGDHEDQESRLARRELGGLGSSPPRCASKCGKCKPCTAVHVPVPPGTPVTAEYYPEAWRCKCGNRFYIP